MSTPRVRPSLSTPPLGFDPDAAAAHDATVVAEAHPPANDDDGFDAATAEVSALHQRALLRYGRGDLVLAAADWQRILTLQPGHAQATAMLQACWEEVLTRRTGNAAR